MLHLIASVLKPGRPRTWTLTGSSGSPTNRGYTALDPAEGNVVWYICGATGALNTTKGYIMNDGYDTGDAVSLSQSHAFTNPLEGFGTIYVRLTADSGVADASSHAIDGSTWHSLTEDSHNIWWRETHNGAVAETCVVKVEIATDSGGTNIVATGYYQSTVSAEP